MTEKNIYQRLHEVMKKVEYVQKGEKKDGIQYRFVSHDAVTAKVRPALVECGIVYHPKNMVVRQNGNRTEVELDIRFVNIDKPEDFVDVPSFGYGIDSQDKGPGKAISYAVKYALLKSLGLETGDDPEADNVDHTPEAKFTPENKSLQAEVITKIALSKDEAEIQSVLDEYDVSKLPDEMQGLINDQLDNRRQQIKDGVVPPATTHRFTGVEDAIAWMTKMKPVIDGFKKPEALVDWQARNQPFIEGLSILKAEKYKKEDKLPKERFLDALAAKLFALGEPPIG